MSDPHENLPVKLDVTKVEPPPTAAPLADRVTVTGSLHYEHTGEEPVAVTGTYHHPTETEHQPYQRRMACYPEWHTVDMGWVPPADVGMVVVQHRRPRHASNPTPEQRKEEEGRVLYVRFGTDSGPGQAVPCGTFVVLRVDGQELQIRGNRANLVGHITVCGR